MPELIEYVRTLADEIGPRPATTDAEHSAASWLEKTFAARGLETELQEFDSPRTYTWAYVIYHLLTMASAFVAGYWGFLVWPAFAVSALVAFFLWTDLDTRFGLTRLMPKGPSQNVIARHIPRARRGERLRKIVIVAHYDSARSSLAFAPNMVSGFGMTFGLLKASTFLTPVLVLAMALPWTAVADPWLWYATMVIAGYLIIPTVINIHREIAMPFVDGANDNASGVAAMIGVMERLVPAPDADNLVTGTFSAVRRDEFAARDAGVVPAGVELTYARDEGAAEPLPDDFSWAEPVHETARSSSSGQGLLDFDTVDFGVVGGPAPEPRPTTAGLTPESGSTWAEDEDDWTGGPPPGGSPQGFSAGVDVLPDDVAGPSPYDTGEPERKERKGLFGGIGKKRRARKAESAEVTDWLGVGDEFDARKAGAEIGSWDNFGGEPAEDEDGFGWKGGWAGDDPFGDPEFARNEAARIRRRVTESVDRELLEKEVWFVATGAEEVGTYGMQTLLRECGEDLRDALIINIDGCGAGQLYWASAEGMARGYRADHRLVSLARRVSRETETVIKPRVYKGLSTDATPALARGFKAISIMAFDASGLPVNWHWKTDTSSACDPALIETTAEFVTAMVREA